MTLHRIGERGVTTPYEPLDPFMQSLLKHMTEAIEDPGRVAAREEFVVRFGPCVACGGDLEWDGDPDGAIYGRCPCGRTTMTWLPKGELDLGLIPAD